MISVSLVKRGEHKPYDLSSGRAPPCRYTAQRTMPNFSNTAEIRILNHRICTKDLTFHALKRNI